MRRAMNLVLRDSYRDDCERATKKWNRTLEEAGLPDRLSLPSQRFNRQVGLYAGMTFDPQGNLLADRDFWSRHPDYLPTKDDYAYVRSLMVPVYELGKIAGWIARPRRGVNDHPFEHEYVKFVGGR